MATLVLRSSQAPILGKRCSPELVFRQDGDAHFSPPSKRPRIEVPSKPLETTTEEEQVEEHKHIPPSRLKTLKCPHEGCDKAFNRPIRLQEHINTHLGIRPHKCEYEGCDRTFFRDTHLKHHVKSEHLKEQNYGCDHSGCNKTFVTRQRLVEHQRRHANPRNTFPCTEFSGCDQVFRKHSTLKAHVERDHNGAKPHPCTHTDALTGESCTKAYDTPTGLKTHIAKSHAPPQHWCTVCILAFPTQPLFAAHAREVHPPTCATCGFTATYESEIRRHIDTHHSDKPLEERQTHICAEPGCGKTFVRAHNLRLHIRSTHEKTKPFVCGTTDLHLTKGLEAWDGAYACGQGFTSKQSLENHVRRLHVDEKAGERAARKEEQRSRQASRRAKVSVADRIVGNDPNNHEIQCVVDGCAVNVSCEEDLATHLLEGHGMEATKIVEALAERRALTGGPFWVSGLEGEGLGFGGEGAVDPALLVKAEDEWRGGGEWGE